MDETRFWIWVARPSGEGRSQGLGTRLFRARMDGADDYTSISTATSGSYSSQEESGAWSSKDESGSGAWSSEEDSDVLPRSPGLEDESGSGTWSSEEVSNALSLGDESGAWSSDDMYTNDVLYSDSLSNISEVDVQYNLSSDESESGSESGGQSQSNLAILCTSLPEFYTPIYEGAQLTVLDSYLLLYQYALRHNLTKDAFSSLISLVVGHLPRSNTVIASLSLYKLKKFFEKHAEYPLYGYCTKCHRSTEGRDGCVNAFILVKGSTGNEGMQLGTEAFSILVVSILKSYYVGQI